MPIVHLTPQFIKQQLVCPADKKRIEFCDTEFPGLYVEVRETSQGQGTYYLRYKNAQGKTRHQKLARTHEMTLSQARARAQQLKAEILQGADPREEQQVRRQMPTFAEFAEQHYLPYAKAHKRSWYTDETLLRYRILPVFGQVRLDLISRAALTQFHSQLFEAGLAPATCDRHIILIRHMLNLAVKWEILAQNPAEKFTLFKADNRRERYLSEKELRRLVHTLETDHNRTVACVVLFLLSTGARVGETLKANWGDIDFDKQSWTIPAANAKSKRARTIPLNGTAIAVLQELQSLQTTMGVVSLSDTAIFISPHTQARMVSIKRAWMRIREKAGLPDVRLHDCRHQFASMLVNSGRSLYEVQNLLGHSDPQITTRYAHLSTTALSQASASAASMIGKVNLRPLQKNDLYRKTSIPSSPSS